MPPREWRQRVGDIVRAVEKIGRYTEGMSLDAFLSDEKTADAVLWNFTVVGEAARHIPAEVETRHTEVPWHRMRGLRNVLVHEYFGVSLTTVWETATRNLPPLVPQLRQILEEEQSS